MKKTISWRMSLVIGIIFLVIQYVSADYLNVFVGFTLNIIGLVAFLSGILGLVKYTVTKKRLDDTVAGNEFLNNKISLSYLNGKIWYRTIKVLYFLFIVFFLIVIFTGGYSCIGHRTTPCDYFHWFRNITLDLLGLGVFFEIVRRIFYYIILGSINPKK